MDAMEVMLASEQYKSPPVAVGELVLYKRLKQEGWDLGWVAVPKVKHWKPGDPVGKQIDIRILPKNFGSPLTVDNCVHEGDPLYVHDNTNTRSCWAKVGPVAASLSDMGAMYNELLAELKKSHDTNGVIGKLKAELAQLKVIADNNQSDISKMSAQISQIAQAVQKKPQSVQQKQQQQE